MKHFKLLIILFVCMGNLNGFAQVEDNSEAGIACYNCCRPDALAPAGVMTDHVHEKGKFAIAYGYMHMQMQGNLNGTNIVSDEQIFANYMMAPAKMTMQMHMLMPMYGISDKFTVMAMLNYNVNNMSMNMMPMQSMPGMNSVDYSAMPTKSKSSGLGDTKLYALYNVLKNCCHRLVVGLGFSFPTGNITTKGSTLISSNDLLPYNMQLGTGTYNFLPSLVYVNQKGSISFGAALTANIKPGVNSRNYCFGNEYSFSPWAAYKLLPWASLSLRVEAYRAEALYGWDKDIHVSSANDPSANYKNYGKQDRLNSFVGINLYARTSFLKGLRLLVEYQLPIYQDLQGQQMPVKYGLSGRLQYNF